MSKKNKKDKELDIILEQLKKSYGTESSDDITDDSYESEEDLELSAVLSKLFGEESDDAESTDTLITEDETEEEIVDEKDEIIVESDDAEENTEILIESENFDEDEEDPVELQALEDSEDITEYPEEISNLTDDLDEAEEAPIFLDSIDENDEVFDEEDETFVDETDEYETPYEDEDLTESEDLDDLEDIAALFDETDDLDQVEVYDEDNNDFSAEEILSLEEPEFAVEDEEYDVKPDHNEIEQPIDNEIEYVIADEPEIDDSSDSETDEPVIPERIDPILILDPKLYTFDELQEQLPKFKRITINPDQPETVEDIAEETAVVTEEHFDDNDISLLLKLGYDDEIKSKVGEEKTQNAILESNSDFVAEDNKTPYGFCGEELTDKSQIPSISQKYKAAKKSLIITLASVFVLFLMISSITVYFDCYSTRTESFPILLFIELVLVALIGLVLYKKLLAGIIGIIKFEPDQYSVLAFVTAIYALYDVLALIIYALNHSSMQRSDFSLFGVCVALYALLTVTADLVTCFKEAANFELIATSNKLFVAENVDPDELNHTQNEKTYRIRKASLISGYFKKTSHIGVPSVNLIYIMGVVPLIALIIGCAFAIPTGNVMSGIASATVAVFLCIPLSCVCIFPFHEHITSTKLAGDKIALIGYDAAEEYAKIQNVIFKDSDVVSVNSYSEIQPQNAVGNSSLNIAYNVFNALNGTLSSTGKIPKSQDNKDVVINSISDNGIDLTYSASTNILFGDKNYMKAHNIKVKTDSTLHGATKGADRSVLYMAFDGIPKLGFILGSSIDGKFIKSAHELELCGVKVFVESYEPHINDVYFAQNADEKLSVATFKPKDREPHTYSDIANGNVVSASGCFRLTKIIRTCQQIVRQRKICKYINYGLMATGLILSCLLAFVINSDANSAILDFIKTHSSLILNIGLLLGLVPTLIYLLKFRKEISEPKKTTLQNGDKKQK